MVDESSYLTTQEAALAVVATAMKKARLPLDTLIINSFMGGVLFTAGGMLHVMILSNCPEVYQTNPGFIQLLQGLVYPVGLFYVVIMGADLFNSNVLFFSVGLARRAVSVLDLLVSWLVSWWFNLVGNIFVCYIICHFSAITSTEAMIEGSRIILEEKASPMFHQTLIKGMAGNFFVCLAIYLQLMAKPLHVKFFMMLIPVFTFVSMGFSHSVADMYQVIMGLINNHGDVSVATVAWKVLLPSTLGNIIGGSFFGLVVPWYLHLFVVERDQKRLNLPSYDMRDEQPELNQDSRVVRVDPRAELEAEEENELEEELREEAEKKADSSSLSSSRSEGDPPVGLYRQPTTRSTRSARSTRSLRRTKTHRSPSNVFPVYGMEAPRQREMSIATGWNTAESHHESGSEDDEEHGAEFLTDQLRKTLTRKPSKKVKTRHNDLEAQPSVNSQHLPRQRSTSTISIPRQLKSFSFTKNNGDPKNDPDQIHTRLRNAGITSKAVGASSEAAGISDFMTERIKAKTMMRQSSSNIGPKTDVSRPETPQSSSTVRPYEPAENDDQ